MFTQRKKRRLKKIYVMLIAVLLIIIALLIGIKLQKNNENKVINNAIVSRNITKEVVKEKPVKQETYYLAKLNNDSICIFFSDEEGKLIELEKTTIIFETLNKEDQNKFIEGIKVTTREQLNDLIMNYES